jgi:hypothetical protein
MANSNRVNRTRETEWSFVELVIGGRYLDPQKVSEALGIPPDSCGKRGEPASSKSKRIRKAGSWVLESTQSKWRIETQMRDILKRISPVKEHLRRLIQEDATVERAYLLVALSPPEGQPAASYSFPSELVQKFASLGLDIVVSIYFYGSRTESSRVAAH